MRVKFNVAAIGQTRWYEYVLRFFFGGLITVMTGLIAQKFGPEIGGLFLAFPAIFPASATLIEKHERERKEKIGLHGTQRGRMAAGLDADGAAIGSLGLLTFAFLVWRGMAYFHSAIVILAATFMWLLTSFFIWYVRKFVI
jgi:hypothetical protein